MASYLYVKINNSSTKSYNIKSTANKPYIQVDTKGYIPITTNTATTGVMVRVGGSNYRLADYTTTSTATTTGTSYLTSAKTTGTSYLTSTRASTSSTGYLTRSSTSATGYQVRTSSTHLVIESESFLNQQTSNFLESWHDGKGRMMDFNKKLAYTSTSSTTKLGLFFGNSKVKASLVIGNSTTTIPISSSISSSSNRGTVIASPGKIYTRDSMLSLTVDFYIAGTQTRYYRTYGQSQKINFPQIILDYSDAITDYLTKTDGSYSSTYSNRSMEATEGYETIFSGAEYKNTISVFPTSNSVVVSYIGTENSAFSMTSKYYRDCYYTDTIATTYATRSSTSTTYATRSSQYTSSTSYLTQSETYQTSYITTSTSTTIEG